MPGWVGTGYNVTGATNVPDTVEIVANQMVVLDENGRNRRPAGRQPASAAG